MPLLCAVEMQFLQLFERSTDRHTAHFASVQPRHTTDAQSRQQGSAKETLKRIKGKNNLLWNFHDEIKYMSLMSRMCQMFNNCVGFVPINSIISSLVNLALNLLSLLMLYHDFRFFF